MCLEREVDKLGKTIDQIGERIEDVNSERNCATCKNNVKFPPPHTCDVCASLDEEPFCMWESK